MAKKAFGILVARFRIFQTQVCTSVQNARLLILATCALHNFLRQNTLNCYLSNGNIDKKNVNELEISRGDRRKIKNNFINMRKIPQKSSTIAKDIQHRFCNCFNNEGAVPWQKEMCKLH